MNFLVELLAISIGGAIGVSIRHLTTVAVVEGFGGSAPVGTTIANVIGCSCIGWAVTMTMMPSAPISPTALIAIRVGAIGGLTTFSSFIADAFGMAEKGNFGGLATYIASNLVIGTLAFVVTVAVARRFHGVL